jgi:hypothetical protein
MTEKNPSLTEFLSQLQADMSEGKTKGKAELSFEETLDSTEPLVKQGYEETRLALLKYMKQIDAKNPDDRAKPIQMLAATTGVLSMTLSALLTLTGDDLPKVRSLVEAMLLGELLNKKLSRR